MSRTARHIKRENERPVDVARRLHRAGAPGLLFYDSAHGAGARWSIITCAPRRVLTEEGDGQLVEQPEGRAVDDPLTWLADADSFASNRTEHDERALPFYGGLAGMLGFEFAWWLDDVQAERQPSPTPVLWVGDYPTALVYSHEQDRWWMTGAPDTKAAALLEDALDASAPDEARSGRGRDFSLTVSAPTYAERVQQAIEAIYAGELFEVNYTERFRASWEGDAFSLYEALRQTSSGAYGGYLNAGSFQLASVSPEQFLEVDRFGDGGRRRVVTRPIKGTRRRGQTPDEDEQLASELRDSAKDRAENVMIVDLMRNDLTQVCRLGTVEATEICALHSFSGVHHLISTVEGELAEEFAPLEALLASFPPGSITGAPKLRSIELIAELEESARGPYTGSLFYASSHGRLDSNVLIRTAVLVDETVWYGSGGAVVADSNPREEYEEACVKAAPLREVIGDG